MEQFDVAEGDDTRVDLVLPGREVISARIVDLETGEPIAGSIVQIWTREPRTTRLEQCSRGIAAGVCEIRNVVAGEVLLLFVARKKGDLVAPEGNSFGQPEKYAPARIEQDVVAGEGLHLGEVPLARYRTAHGRWGGGHSYAQPGGALGFKTSAVSASWRRQDAAVIRVTEVDPNGTAAEFGLEAGDIIVSVDGYDVRGRRSYLYKTLSNVPEGTSLDLELERGVKITIEAGEAPEVQVFARSGDDPARG
jgi:hypothetical protein